MAKLLARNGKLLTRNGKLLTAVDGCCFVQARDCTSNDLLDKWVKLADLIAAGGAGAYCADDEKFYFDLSDQSLCPGTIITLDDAEKLDSCEDACGKNCIACGRFSNWCCISDQSYVELSWSITGPLPPDVEAFRTGSETLPFTGWGLLGLSDKWIVYHKVIPVVLDCGTFYLLIYAAWNCNQHNDSPNVQIQTLLYVDNPDTDDIEQLITNAGLEANEDYFSAFYGANSWGKEVRPDCCGWMGSSTSSASATYERPCGGPFSQGGVATVSTWTMEVKNNHCCYDGSGGTDSDCIKATAEDCDGGCEEEDI